MENAQVIRGSRYQGKYQAWKWLGRVRGTGTRVEAGTDPETPPVGLCKIGLINADLALAFLHGIRLTLEKERVINDGPLRLTDACVEVLFGN